LGQRHNDKLASAAAIAALIRWSRSFRPALGDSYVGFCWIILALAGTYVIVLKSWP
jgi:hypothetical protein